MGKEKIAAIVVTCNRKKLLRECLNALLNQTRKPDSIIIVENASTDGTRIMLEEEFLDNPVFDYIELEENTGCTGGFYTGIKRGYEKHFDLVWCMDDDGIPKSNALEELLKAREFLIKNNVEKIGFLCSRVVSKSGKEMNVPPIDTRRRKGNYPGWGEFLERGIVKVFTGTFVSLLIPSQVISEKGLPLFKFFIWGGDTEYTQRISKGYPGFLVGRSVVTHKRKIEAPPGIILENDPERIKNQYYKYRNAIYIRRRSGKYWEISYLYFKILEDTVKVLVKSKEHKRLKLKIMLKVMSKGLFDALLLNLDNEN